MAKAGRPKTGSAKLPDWFDVENYRETRTFGAGEWFEQFAFRKKMFDRFQVFQTAHCEAGNACRYGNLLKDNAGGEENAGGTRTPKMSVEEARSEARGWMLLCDVLWEHPIVTAKRILDASSDKCEADGEVYLDLNDANMAVLNATDICEKGVREVTNKDIYNSYRSFPDQARHSLAAALEAPDDSYIYTKLRAADHDTYMFLEMACDLPRVEFDFTLRRKISSIKEPSLSREGVPITEQRNAVLFRLRPSLS